MQKPKDAGTNANSADNKPKNPRSLVELLGAIRKSHGHRTTQEEFAEILNLHGTRFRTKPLRKDSIQNLEHDTNFIRYVDLERYAHYLGLPVGMLLLFSRMTANVRLKKEDNKILAQMIIAAMQRIADGDEALDINELRKWGNIFSADQGSLFSIRPASN
ncbi:hypothetical protein [Dongia sedimenti]|uniref:XRE family transcriptional regulator n=1 Tax=Dongia sedimenti TaxID=3064282 RepID=A0ABU0YPH5_9PROT|nr:hypothetical protein [Rhodospirillaceae bacterium R-7]